jgi:hypothetical protein
MPRIIIFLFEKFIPKAPSRLEATSPDYDNGALPSGRLFVFVCVCHVCSFLVL